LYQQIVNIKIIEAKTGLLIKELRVEGDVPSCPRSLYVSGSNTGGLNINDMLAKIVEP